MTQVKVRALLRGSLTMVPLLRRYTCRGTGGSTDARYCYSVWLRHLVLAHSAGVRFPVRSVAELGPGDSLGTGLAAMLCGAECYYALDALLHAPAPRNLEVFETLVDLFSKRAPIPNQTEFPLVKPPLESYDFPFAILTDDIMRRCLAADRLASIRRALVEPGAHGMIEIRYVAPWDDSALVLPSSVDMVFSQAVMEHVKEIAGTYAALKEWLRPGGFMSHTIDFKCHDTTTLWNGHWTVPDFMWKLVHGSRPYLINRQPYSSHVTEMERTGFQIVGTRLTHGAPLSRRDLAPRFRNLSDDDLTIAGAFVQAIKPA